MRAYLLLGFAAVVGCSTPDPCSGKGAECVTVHVDGNAKDLDQLQVTIDKPMMETLTDPNPAAGFSLPVQLAVILPSGASGHITMTVSGLSKGAVVASDVKGIDLAASGNKASFTLNTGGSGVDLLPPADLRPSMDMAGAIALGGTDAKSVAEGDTINVTFTATDPEGGTPTISADELPMGAQFTGGAGMATLTWTPNFKQAGIYTIPITATPSDASRAVQQDLVITVQNKFDQFIGPTSSVAPVPIGDFDGDGIPDLAQCTLAGGLYQVTIIYGDAAGLPLTTPYPPNRFDSFQLGGASPFTATCFAGADFDEDGREDFILADEYNSSRGAGQSGVAYVVFGQPRAQGVPSTIMLTDGAPTGTNENFGGSVVAGDFDGDGHRDVVVSASGGGTPANVAIFLSRAGRTGSPLGPSMLFQSPGMCGSNFVLGMRDLDGDGKDEILQANSDVGAPAGSGCTGSNQQLYGGVRVLHFNGIAIPPMATSFLRPTGEQFGWGPGSILCDVDHDGVADLVARSISSPAFYVFFGVGNNSYFANPLNEGAAVKLAPVSDPWSNAACPSGFAGMGDALAFGAPGPFSLMPPGYTMPGAVVVAPGGSRTPSVSITLSPPDNTITGFGQQISAVGDFNSDGKGDLIINSPSSTWMAYGQ